MKKPPTPEQRERARLRAAEWRKNNPERTKELSARSRELRKANWAAFLEQERARYARSREKKLAWQAAWNAANPERRAATVKRYRKKRPHIATAAVAKRKAAKLRATPPWADLEAIKAMYLAARMISRMMEQPYEVDHIIPLQGANVCGLHVVYNLRVAERSENRRKAAKVIDE